MPARYDCRILVIDDDREFRRSLMKILQKAGFQVNMAGSGYQTTLLLEQEYFPIVVMDLKMPGTSGLELLREIKAKSPSSKVIVVTAGGDDANLRDAMAAGAFDCLRKPLKREEIFGCARRALESTKEV